MSSAAYVVGKNSKAKFTLKIHRGERMCLLAMSWKKGKPPNDFVGFAIDYVEPGGRLMHVRNRITFPEDSGSVSKRALSSHVAPIQKFRWVHFPNDAHQPGKFAYTVTPVFMDAHDQLSYGEPQKAAIDLSTETHPGKLSVNFTRGFISSQAFVDRFASDNAQVNTILPGKGEIAITFQPSHKNAEQALSWMGFDGRKASLALLDAAIADKHAEVSMVAYDLDSPEIMERLKKLGKRVRVIIDNDPNSAHEVSKRRPDEPDENRAEQFLKKSAGASNVKRQHMASIQHNKMLVVQSPKLQAAICGSTNYSWRGYYVQNNHVVIVSGKKAVKPFADAFEQYWSSDSPDEFAKSDCSDWKALGLSGVDVQVTFSPHGKQKSVLQSVGDDIRTAKSSVLYSIAFLGASSGAIHDAIFDLTSAGKVFVYGIADKPIKTKVATGHRAATDHNFKGIVLQQSDGNIAPVNPQQLAAGAPEPFKSEPTGGSGARMHHKFVVIDFGTPDARVYFGSHNMSLSADEKNGENLLLVKDPRVATAFGIEALRIFDHYEFRVAADAAKKAKHQFKQVALKKPPRATGEQAWWEKDYTVSHRIRDRELFS